MALSQAVAAAVVGVAVVSLSGCGGSGPDGPDGPDGPGGRTTNGPPVATTTTSADPCNGFQPAPAGTGADAALVDELNWRFMNFEKDNISSPVGLVIRMIAPDQGPEFFCGTPCHNGYPDCRISASLYNNKMMMVKDTNHVAITMNRQAGIIYNQTSIEKRLAKCVYMYDAATWGRTNHGCGCARPQNCGSLDGAYGNQDCTYLHPDAHDGIIKSTCKNNTDKSPFVDACWCGSKHRDPATPLPQEATTVDQQCFFRGPALYPPGGMLEHEFHEMVVARIFNQANPPEEDSANRTIIKQEFWNEVIVEAEQLGDLLNEDPRSAYAAFMYVKGELDGKKKAQLMQQLTAQKYGGEPVPIVEFDPEVNTLCTAPFAVASDLPSTTPLPTTTSYDPNACVAQYKRCGGQGHTGGTECCEGFECHLDNPYYASCQPPTTTTTPSEGPVAFIVDAFEEEPSQAPSQGASRVLGPLGIGAVLCIGLGLLAFSVSRRGPEGERVVELGDMTRC